MSTKTYAQSYADRRRHQAQAVKLRQAEALKRLQEVRAAKMPAPKRGRTETKTAISETNPPKSGKKSVICEPKPPYKKRIKPASKKRARQLRKYSKLRDAFLANHTVCEFQYNGCTQVATEVHHEKGREGEQLLKVEDWRAGCNNCHGIATEKSREAISAGHSQSRLGKPKRNAV